MHWILQENTFKEAAYDVLLETLDRYQLPYTVHKVIPFVGDVEPVPVVSGPAIAFGSYSMRHASAKYGWSPGVIDLEPYDFRVQRANWGKHMLNHDSTVVKFTDVKLAEPSFVRPISDSKAFTGRTFSPEEMAEWIHKVVDLGHDYGDDVKNQLVQVSTVKRILSETRYWVVDGRIVTSSTYKEGTRVVYKPSLDSTLEIFARARVREWEPVRAFVLDVADTPDGAKVVEINTLNSSGFYAANLGLLVEALETAFG